MEQRILKLISSPQFLGLKSFYNTTTLFNVIGAERNENRHSAFLRWIFSTDASHGLGDEPLKLFLRLVAVQKWGKQTFGEGLYEKVLTGNFNLELLEPIEVEKNVGELNNRGKDDKDRIDVWMTVKLSYSIDGEDYNKVFPIVIENKINSREGNEQTKRYYTAMMNYVNTMQKETGMNYQPIGILLAPNIPNASCDQFVSITYQQLLDYVLEPINAMTMPPTEKSFVLTYIRNLGRPSDAAQHDYSPLAISKEEKILIKEVYELDPDLFDEMLVAIYGSKTKKIFDKSRYTKLDQAIDDSKQRFLQELWDANEDVFKAIVYQMCETQRDVLARIFKGNNRDNSKYRVFYGKDKQEVFPDKRLSKAMAACAIFKAYLKENTATLEQLRKAFPCEDINAYYYENYYADLFYPVPSEVDDNGEPCLEYTAEKRKGKTSLAKGDFYLNDDCLLHLSDGTQAMCVKMWRKEAFDRLLEHIKDYNGIYVERCL